MKRFLSAVGLSVGLTLASVPVTTVPSLAQDLELRLDRNGPQLRLRDDCDPDREDCRDYRRGGERYRERAMRECTEDRALDKAERMGLRRARITDVGRGTIEVTGRDRRGDRVFITFGRRGNCPILN